MAADGSSASRASVAGIDGVEVLGAMEDGYGEILTAEALAFGPQDQRGFFRQID